MALFFLLWEGPVQLDEIKGNVLSATSRCREGRICSVICFNGPVKGVKRNNRFRYFDRMVNNRLKK
ncbi:MAG: hypothetical protein K0R28_6036 [Paenibacillus sp.]|nr:hypothetical protein [Paenibacillus sp.]